MANSCVVAKALSVEVLAWTVREQVENDVCPWLASISWRTSRLLL